MGLISPIPRPFADVLTLDAVARHERKKLGPTNAQRLQPVIDLALGIPRIETDPIRIRVFAVREKVPNGQVRGVGDVVRPLKRCVHQTDQAARHDRMAAEHRPHVDDRDVRARPSGIQRRRQTGNPGADDDEVRLWWWRGGSQGFCTRNLGPIPPSEQTQQAARWFS